MSVSGPRIYRTLIALLPSDFQARNSAEMEDLFAEALAESRRRGRLAPLGTWLRGTLDIIGYVVRARLLGWRPDSSGARAGSGPTLSDHTPTGGPSRGPGSMPGILLGDLRYAVRTLRKNPGFTTVAVLSLALGIGATSTIFSVLNAAVLRRLPFPEPDRLVDIREFDPERGRALAPTVATFLAWREQNQTFEQMALWEGIQGGADFVPVSTAGGTERVRIGVEGVNLFRLLGVEPVLGRTFVAEDVSEPPFASTVVISFGLWQQLFGGDPAALGQELTLHREGTKTIVGVMPPGFRVNPQSSMAHAWVGDDYTQASLTVVQNAGRNNVVGRLKGGVSVEQARADLQAISRRLALDTATEDTPWQAQVEPLAKRLSVRYAGTLYVLFGVVGCVLLIACLNVATLSLSRAAARRQEIGTRLALGAGRWRVVRQLLTESLLLALLGGVLGVGLAVAGIQLFIALAAGWYPPTDEIQINGTVLGFTVALAFLTGIVSGVAPALRSSAVNLTDSLKAGAQGALGRSRHRVSDVLVVAQAALALVLLVGAGLHAEQLRSARPGRSRLPVRPALDDQVRSTTRQVSED